MGAVMEITDWSNYRREKALQAIIAMDEFAVIDEAAIKAPVLKVGNP
jgi:hypothetical protein